MVTAVIGAGVLNLPYSISMLGWLGGPLTTLVFAVLTLYTSQLLADLYVVNGERQTTYTGLVQTVMGRWGFITIGM